MKDPFVHCRVAGVMALMATVECFEPEELATKVIPNMACGMVDKEKLVRDQAFKAMELFVKRLQENAAAMPETAATENEVMPGFNLPPTSPGGTNTLVSCGSSGCARRLGDLLSGKKACRWRPVQYPRRWHTLAPNISATSRIASSSICGHARDRCGEAARAYAVVACSTAASERERHFLLQSKEHAPRREQSHRKLEPVGLGDGGCCGG
ncbi:hypothetical protein C8Q72DRAFT_207190 [Fomitopsis betulina]|nr:hypothetical protein C8Q72DRAFT_207190 [Fomitopsis betulina]